MVAQDQEKPRQMTRWPLVLLDGRLQWRITKPAKGADAITDDVRRLRAEMLAAGVQLIADNRSLLIVAPANWTRAELPLLVAHVGAVLDLLHVQSDQRQKIQAISEPVQSGCAGSD